MAVQQVTATGTDTTTSATYALLSGMTITPGAGDYIVSFTSYCGCTSESNIFFQVFVNGVAVAHTERYFFHESSIIGAGTYEAAQIYAYLPSVGNSEAVEIRWNRDTAGTASCLHRTMTLEEVDSTDVQQATATADTTTTSTTDVLMDSMTLSAASSGSHIAYFSTSMWGDSGADMRISFYVNGVQQAHTERRQFQESSIIDTAFMMGMVAGIEAGANDTVDVRWRTTATDDANAAERTLVLQKVDSYQQATATASTTRDVDTFAVLDSMTLTPATTGDYMAFFSTSMEGDSSGNNQGLFALYENAVQEAHTFRITTQESSIADTTLPVANHGYFPSASDTIDVRWSWPDSGTGTAWERTLVLYEYEGSSSSSSTSSSSSSSSSSQSSSSSSSSVSSSSTSSSSSSCASGTVSWGHVTGVEEDFTETFTGSVTTSGWAVSGSGDGEIVYITTTPNCDQIIVFEPWCLGAFEAQITYDKYDTGTGIDGIIQYRTAATKAALGGVWTTYNGVSFTSLGWVEVRIVNV